MSLAVSNLSFGYNGRMVVDQVSFDLAPGRILAILGPNGVGKTTLLKCLNAILKPRGGTVLVEDIDVLCLSRREVARRFGYVPQRLEAGRLTVFDAVLLGRTPHLGLRPSVHDVAVVERVILRLGLAPLGLRHLDRLSGGELQKVAVARALAQEPRILLFDEPTASLDLKNQMDILGTIREVVAGQNVSAVLTMHDVSAALRFADACLLIEIRPGAGPCRGGRAVRRDDRRGLRPAGPGRDRIRPTRSSSPAPETQTRRDMSCTIPNDRIKETIAFHGHVCPGLSYGIRAAELCLSRLGANTADNPVVAVVETDMCGVDAIQFLTGCTFGKGNLIHRDLGKMAFNFYTPPPTNGGVPGGHQALRPGRAERGDAGPDAKTRTLARGALASGRAAPRGPGADHDRADRGHLRGRYTADSLPAAGQHPGEPGLRGLRRADHGVAHPALRRPDPVHPLLQRRGAEDVNQPVEAFSSLLPHPASAPTQAARLIQHACAKRIKPGCAVC